MTSLTIKSTAATTNKVSQSAVKEVSQGDMLIAQRERNRAQYKGQSDNKKEKVSYLDNILQSRFFDYERNYR
jgi:hypothetical protein